MEVDHLKTNVEYKLSRIIEAHSKDVKSLAITETGAVVSASRDEFVKMFIEREDEFVLFFEVNNKQIVNAVDVYHCPDGSILIFCGRKDGSIVAYNAESTEPQFVFTEHTLNVCVLRVSHRHAQMISGSWDTRAVVFNLNDLIFGQPPKQFTLEGHKNSIWDAEFVSQQQNQFLTASADKTIKLWTEGTAILTFNGHNDVVRSLISLNEALFISAGNDSTIRVWNISTGKCERTIESNAGEFIYSMTQVRTPDGRQLIVTSGECGYVEFFGCDDEGKLTFGQVIRTPATSLWSIHSLPNGDLAVAADNGLIYLFTASADRVAPATILEAFDSTVASKVAMEVEMKAAQEQDVVTIKVTLDDGAPMLELKYVKGSNPADAAEKFIRDNNLPFSYLDEITEYIKTNIPEARNYGTYQPAKSTIQQKKDYEFPITLEDGCTFVLGYNVGDDPEMTVQKFCEDNKLPIKLLSQLSNVLRAQVPELQGLQGQGYIDPFTGGGRYVPGAMPSTTNGSDMSTGGDPFTSAGRYVPGSSSTTNGDSYGGDPYTSVNRYIPGGHESASNSLLPNSLGPVDPRRPRSELVPVRQYYSFGYEGASSKAQEALKLANEKMDNNLMLEEPLLESLMEILSGVFTASEIHNMALEKALGWPLDSIVPVLDVFRLAILDSSINEHFCSIQSGGCGQHTLARMVDILVSEPAPPVRILVCRLLVNAAKHQPGRDMLSLNLSQLSELVTKQVFIPDSKPALQLAATSCLANIALILLHQTEKGVCTELGPREDVLRSIIKFAENVESFGSFPEPPLQRLLQAIVTLMWGDSAVIELGKNRGISQIAIRIKDAVASDDSKKIARDIYAMTV